MADGDKKWFNKIITGDETWCFAYDSKTKRQISGWFGETIPRPKKLKFPSSRIKIMLIFFDSQGVVHKEFLPERKTVTAEFYRLKDRLLKRIQWVPPGALLSRIFFLLHDKASAHKAAIVCQFVTQKDVTTFIRPRTH
jgi:hypothetical protein